VQDCKLSTTGAELLGLDKARDIEGSIILEQNLLSNSTTLWAEKKESDKEGLQERNIINNNSSH